MGVRRKFNRAGLLKVSICGLTRCESAIVTCARLPFLVMSENAIVFVGVGVVGSFSSSRSTAVSRWDLRTGNGTSNKVLRSNLRESRLSAIIFSKASSKAASASGSSCSSGRVTTICSSSLSEVSELEWSWSGTLTCQIIPFRVTKSLTSISSSVNLASSPSTNASPSMPSSESESSPSSSGSAAFSCASSL